MKTTYKARMSGSRKFNTTLATIIAQFGSGYTVHQKSVPSPFKLRRVRTHRQSNGVTCYRPSKLAGPIGKLP